jgi:hypothetical protein
MEGVTEYCANRNALFVTLDEAMAYLRDLNRSRLTGSEVDGNGDVILRFAGTSLGATKMAVYADDTLGPEWHEVPPFEDGASFRLRPRVAVRGKGGP